MSIEMYAFVDCNCIESIQVDKNNTIYDSRDHCNAIIETESNTLILGCKTTKIPDSVTSIGERAFYSCSNLTTIRIPQNVSSIGYDAFGECKGLKSIIFTNNKPPINENIYLSKREYENVILFVPCSSIEAYKADQIWGQYDIQCIDEDDTADKI